MSAFSTFFMKLEDTINLTCINDRLKLRRGAHPERLSEAYRPKPMGRVCPVARV